MNPTSKELKKTRSYGPDVRLVRQAGRLVVEKTYRHRRLPVRMAGMGLVSWERFIYARLEGIEGIPTVLVSPDRYTLVTTFMGGENLRETHRNPDGRYYDAVRRIIAQMHARGVVHLDLRNRRNYGIDEQGRPYLIDFASALYLPRPRSLRRALEVIDWLGLLKVQSKISPDLLTCEQRRRAEVGDRLSRLWVPGRLAGLVRDLLKSLG